MQKINLKKGIGAKIADSFVTFDSGEFEIAIVTYNRCEFVAEWMKYCYKQVRQRNIRISIYDSSTSDDTEKYINEFKAEMNDVEMEYYHVASDINIGYKPMLPILNSKSKYVWVSGDSRCCDFEWLDRKVFPYLRQQTIDYVVFHILNNEENDGKIYVDNDEMLKDCFVSMTCIGLSIYKVALFDLLKHDKQLMDECNQKYGNNFGFAWIGYFLEAFFSSEHKALFSVIPNIDLKADIKVPSWFGRCYGCWVEDLCNLMDALSEKYRCTESVMRDTWKYIAIDSPGFCDFARKKGDLNKETYTRYKNSGMLERVTRQVKRLERFANAKDEELDKCYIQEVQIEKREFEELCHRKIEQIRSQSSRKKLWVYGAGTGGKILIKCLKEHEVPVCGFLDKDAEIIEKYDGLPVKSIDSINAKESFIVISLFHWMPFIVKSLLEHGVYRCNIMYLSIDE